MFRSFGAMLGSFWGHVGVRMSTINRITSHHMMMIIMMNMMTIMIIIMMIMIMKMIIALIQ